MDYQEFLNNKAQLGTFDGFDPIWMPDFLFDFQKHLVDWAIRKGRSAIFADCGLGKTAMSLVWAENIIKKENGNVLIVTPLAVSHQTIREGEKFGMEVKRTNDGKVHRGINVTNYERLHLYDTNDFVGVICDESSILKNFNGMTKTAINEFMKKKKYRLLCTATAAPNDYIELGTSSEALGNLGYMDMLNLFFKNTQNNSAQGRMYGQMIKWRLKGHAETPFWKWVCSWARAIRKPSDLGFENNGFALPPLEEQEHVISTDKPPDGMLFPVAAIGLKEQREERRRTIQERCEYAADLARHGKQVILWGHLNDECDLLEQLIPDSRQISGGDADDYKERTLIDFIEGNLRVLITKPKIGAFGLNLQNCSHQIFFITHSYEQYYQGVRRCWRFGQKNPVHIDVVCSEGEIDVLKNLQRKARQADEMFDKIVGFMNDALAVNNTKQFIEKETIPTWL